MCWIGGVVSNMRVLCVCEISGVVSSVRVRLVWSRE